VRVLEQGTPGCGSSHGNCGTITPSHAPPLAMPGPARDCWQRSLPRSKRPCFPPSFSHCIRGHHITNRFRLLLCR